MSQELKDEIQVRLLYSFFWGRFHITKEVFLKEVSYGMIAKFDPVQAASIATGLQRINFAGIP